MSKTWAPPPEWKQQPQPTLPNPGVPPRSGGSRLTRNILLAVIAGVLVLVGIFILIGVAGLAAEEAKLTDGKPIATAPDSTAPEPAEAAPALPPSPSEFTITLKILSKQCFGSAGCSITYRIDPAYSGPPLDSSKVYNVTYQVRGDESGPITNSFTLQGDQVEYQQEEMASTKSSAVRLTAKVVEVLEN